MVIHKMTKYLKIVSSLYKNLLKKKLHLHLLMLLFKWKNKININGGQLQMMEKYIQVGKIQLNI